MTAEKPPFLAETVPEQSFALGRVRNLGLVSLEVPGVNAVRRTQDAVEPVIRGLGWERVETLVNGLSLHGACAARMDPPATLMSGSSVREASLVKGLSTVTAGPGGTGGRLVVSTDFERPETAGRQFDAWIRGAIDGTREGLSSEAGIQGGTERFDFSAGAQAIGGGSYVSPGGILVPADAEQSGEFLSLGYRPEAGQRMLATALFRQGGWTDFPSLPMDAVWDRIRIYGAAYRLRSSDPDRSLAGFDFRVGLANLDHLMNNERKPTWSFMPSESRSMADSFSGGFTSRWNLGDGIALAAGMDLLNLQRNALRTRLMVMTGMTQTDHLWPDVTQENLGLFAELSLASGSGWQVRIGARGDDGTSKAGAADDTGLMGRSIRQNYVFFYGPDAAETDRSDRLFGGNIVVGKRISQHVTLQGGAGLVSRSPNTTERYFSFAPAPGGYVVGDPALDPETKREVAVGAELAWEKLSATAAVFYYDFRDYISGIVLAQADLNGDRVPDTIRGFVNVDAILTGGELDMLIRPTANLTFPVSLAYVWGENRETNVPLPEIPPLEARAAARWSLPGQEAGWIELGGRFDHRQDRIDPGYGENATPGFSVWHLRGLVRIANGIQVEAGIENLFNKEYHDHLTPTAALPTGGLKAGDEIPAPGRSLVLSIRADF